MGGWGGGGGGAAGPPLLKYPGCPPLGGEGRRKRSEWGPPPSRRSPLLGCPCESRSRLRAAGGGGQRRPELGGRPLALPATSCRSAFLRLPALGREGRESSLPFPALPVSASRSLSSLLPLLFLASSHSPLCAAPCAGSSTVLSPPLPLCPCFPYFSFPFSLSSPLSSCLYNSSLPLLFPPL